MITAERLILRPWTETDKPGFERIMNTPAMMAHFGGVTARDEFYAIIDRQIASQTADGFSMWAVETRADGALAGICGVQRSPRYAGTPVAGMLEIGWRVAEPLWGQGIAREAAKASLAWAWANTNAPVVGAWTVTGNTRSWGLMERLGMRRRPDLDFLHPRYVGAPGNPLGAMIVYAIDRPTA